MNAESSEIDAGRSRGRSEYDSAVKRDFLRNAIGFAGWEFVWGLGLPFAMSATTVLAYLAELSSPKILIGIIASFPTTLCPLQVIISHLFRNRTRKVWLSLSYILCIAPWLLYNIIFLKCHYKCSHTMQIALFTFCMISFLGITTGNITVYLSLVTDCTPLKKRGSIFGYRIAGLALGTLLMYFPARWIISRWAAPDNFLAAFAVGNVFYMIAGALLLTVREHRDPKVAGYNKYSSETNQLFTTTRLVVWKMLKNPNYRVFLFFIILFYISLILGSFIVVFARETLGLTASGVLTFSLIQIISSAVLTVILGNLADRFGYKAVGIIQGLLLTCGFMVLSFVTLSQNVYGPLIYMGFFLYASITAVAGMVTLNLTVEIFPRRNSGTLLALTNLLIMPAILISIPLAGLIIDLTGSYVIVFTLGAVLALVSTLGFLTLVREPRTRKMYVIKYIRRP